MTKANVEIVQELDVPAHISFRKPATDWLYVLFLCTAEFSTSGASK
jgi:hypothetical protein